MKTNLFLCLLLFFGKLLSLHAQNEPPVETGDFKKTGSY